MKQFSVLSWAFMSGIVFIALSGCASAAKTPPAKGQSYAGWYMEHAGQSTFQPCGQTKQWRVSAPADLVARAKKFGLEQDTPVYVQLLGTAQGDVIAVSRVQQFGSPTPVRNCALTGVVIPNAPQTR